MRTILLGLLLLVLGLPLLSHSSAGLARSQEPDAADLAIPTAPLAIRRTDAAVPTWRAQTMYQVSATEAHQAALRVGRQAIDHYLSERGLVHGLGLTDKNFEARCRVFNWREEKRDFGGNVGTMYRASCDVALPDETLLETLRGERHYRSSERMLWLFKLTGGAFVLLGIVACYLRLEEATKGYSTYLLSLVAGGLGLLVVGVMASLLG